jgi:hypothetical protein
MVEADINLRLLPISILHIYNVFEPLVCCLKGRWVHPYIVIPAKLASDFGIWVTCGVKMMHYVMIEDDNHLGLLLTFILDIYKVFEVLICCVKGILVPSYTKIH